VEQPEEVLVPLPFGQCEQLLGVREGQIDFGGGGAQGEVQSVPAVAQELREDLARIPTLLLDFSHDARDLVAPARECRGEQPVMDGGLYTAHDSRDFFLGYAARSESRQLIEQSDGVTDAAFACPGDQP